jgi:hypothetical protein
VIVMANLARHCWNRDCTRLALHAAVFLLFGALVEAALVTGVIGPASVFGGLVGLTLAGAAGKARVIHDYRTGRIPPHIKENRVDDDHP